MAPPCRSLLDRMLPADPAARAALGNGGAWLAADLQGRGMALYTTAKWGSPAGRWQRICAWLDIALPNAATAREIVARLAPHAAPVSVGLEGASPGDARVKLYWRFSEVVALDTLGIALLARWEFGEFLTIVAGQARIPLSAIVASLSFSLASGEWPTPSSMCAATAFAAPGGSGPRPGPMQRALRSRRVPVRPT